MKKAIVRIICIKLPLGALLLLLFPLALLGQELTAPATELAPVTVKGRRNSGETGHKTQVLDSAVLADNAMLNMGELLTLRTPVYVRNYGPGLLSSPSFRGTGANQSQVYWNGLLLNSPMLGQVDLALLPVFFADEVSIAFGGASLKQGPGGLGGSISLTNKSHYDNGLGLSYGMSLGSFGQFFPHLRASYGAGKWAVDSKVFYRYAENDFTFQNNDILGKPKERLENAQLSQHGLLNGASRKLGKHGELRLDTWLQQSDRQLPHLTIVQINDERQEDFFFRGAVSYEYQKDGTRHGLQFGYLHDDFTYENRLARLQNDNSSNSYQLNGHHGRILTPRLDVEGGFRLKHDDARSDSYLGVETQDLATAHVAANYAVTPTLSARILGRQTVVDEEISPFIPSLGLQWSPGWAKGLELRANANRNFRYPTLNDLYWFPGGNPDLQPEEGWSWEAGVTHRGQKGRLFYKTSLTYFDSKIDNWIQWFPSAGNFWRPRNLKKVRNRGLESSLEMGYSVGKWNSSLYAAYNFTSARDITDMEDRQSDARQLAYLPEHTVQSVLGVGRASWKLSVEQTYTAARYIEPVTPRQLDGFALSNLVLGYDWVKAGASAQIRVNNLWDKTYQSMPFRPMPGRNFLLTINFKIK